MPRLPGGAAQCLLAVTRLSSQNITDSAQPPLTEAEPSGMPQYPGRRQAARAALTSTKMYHCSSIQRVLLGGTVAKDYNETSVLFVSKRK